MFREVTEIDTMNLQKQVYDADDIQKLLGIGRSKAYAFLDEAYESQKPFRVIKIGKLYRVLIGHGTAPWSGSRTNGTPQGRF